MSGDAPRVLHVVTALGIGGVEMWLIALLQHMRASHAAGMAREEFDILMTGGRVDELDEIAASLGATLHYIPFSRTGFWRFAREFRRLLKRRRFTAIHDHQDYSGTWHLLAGLGDLPPTRIIHVHNPPVCLRINTDTPARKAFFELSKRLVSVLVTHVLGTSAQVLREYGFAPASYPRQAIAPLHCGFDTSAFLMSRDEANASVCREFGWPERSRISLFVGRLDGLDPRNPEWNHKNPEFALEVVREAILDGEDVRLVLAGSGAGMRNVLEERVASWGLSDRIRFAGQRRDVARLMAGSHVFLFPSLEEGLGMVAVEAQAAGLYVLASDTIPREAAVLPELVSFKSLGDGALVWARELRRLLSLDRFDQVIANETVQRSPFSIENSYSRLRDVYASPTEFSRRP